MIGLVMAVTMHRPGEVFLEAVAVAVILDHLRVLGQDIKNGRHMG